MLIDFLGEYNYSAESNDRIFTLIAMIVAMTLCSIFINRINALLKGEHSDLISNQLSILITKKINELDISYFDDPKLYDEIQNAKKDSNALSGMSWLFLSIVRGTISVITTALLLGKASFVLPAIVFVFNIPNVFIDKYITKKQYEWERNKTQSNRKIGYLRGILESSHYAKDVRLFGSYDYLLDRQQTLWNNWYKEKRGINIKKLFASLAVSIVPYVPIIYLMIFITYNIIRGEMTIGDYTFYTALINQFQGGVMGLIASFNQGYQGELHLSKFDEFLAWPSRITDTGNLTLSNIDTIEFRNVSFKYPHAKSAIIKNLSFKIDKNEKIALVGINGAGKTTIVKLLLRLYDPEQGEVLFNGIDARKYKLSEIHKAIGVVFQDFNRYYMKLGEVISIANSGKKTSQEKIEHALDAADFRMDDRFMYGLDTYLGKVFDENGVELSGGQWQKLAIAQAYLKDSKFMIFDEPSASLDPAAENLVFQKMTDLCNEKGALFITHRLSCVSNADKIILIENGTCTGIGTHSEMMHNSKTYSELYNMQAGKYLSFK